MIEADRDLGSARGRAGDDAALQRFLDDLAIGAAVDQRLGRRWVHQAAAEEATLTGILTDLAEQRADVTLDVGTDRSVGGRLRSIGRDFVVLVRGRIRHLVATAAVNGIRNQAAGSVPPVGDRDARHDVTLLEVLAAGAPERPEILLHRTTDRQGQGIGGQLLAVGRDVVIVRLRGAASTEVVVPARTLADVQLGDR